MPLTATSEHIWSKCPHNPLETFRHTPLNAETLTLAKKNPGSLVFNSTVSDLLLMKSDDSGRKDDM